MPPGIGQILNPGDRDRREEVDLVFFLTRAAWPHLKTSHGVTDVRNRPSGIKVTFRISKTVPTKEPQR